MKLKIFSKSKAGKAKKIALAAALMVLLGASYASAADRYFFLADDSSSYVPTRVIVIGKGADSINFDNSGGNDCAQNSVTWANRVYFGRSLVGMNANGNIGSGRIVSGTFSPHVLNGSTWTTTGNGPSPGTKLDPVWQSGGYCKHFIDGNDVTFKRYWADDAS